MEWISVEDSLPEVGVDVVCIGGGVIEVCFRSGLDNNPYNWMDFSFEVEYWCYLPELPEGY